MDLEAFEKDLRVEVKKLPPELVGILKDLAGKFGPQLEALIMPAMVNLQRHFMVAMGEIGAGLLDKEDLLESVTKVLKESI